MTNKTPREINVGEIYTTPNGEMCEVIEKKPDPHLNGEIMMYRVTPAEESETAGDYHSEWLHPDDFPSEFLQKDTS